MSVLSPAVVATAGLVARVPVLAWIQNPLSELVGLVPGSGRPRIRHAIVRGVGGAAAAVLVTAPGLRDEWHRAGVSHERIGVLPNGLRLPAPARRERGDVSALRLLSVGRLTPQKRHDVALAALAQLRSSGCPADLEILGVGPMEGALRSLADRLGVRAHVTFAGFVDDPSARYRAADVFVLTSDFEGFGNVLVEAIAHGLPVVSTDAPHGPAFILGGLAGTRLVPRGEPRAVAEGVRAVLAEWRDDPSLATVVRRRAELFSVQRTAAHFDEIVGAVLDSEPLPSWDSGA